MDQATLVKLKEVLLANAVPIGTKILGAIVLWIVGRIVIGAISRGTERALTGRKFDVTLTRYIGSTISVVLSIVLVLAILSIFGVETTSFAGILAAAGVAIGMAWSGLLSNFAAGVFLVVLRPFKVGDFISAGGVMGDVREISLFTTSIDTMDNVRTIVGNSKVFADTIQNFTNNPYRRVELKAQLPGSVDPQDAIKRLKEKLAAIPNVKKDPAPFVDIVDFTPFGPVLAVRPFCHNNHYWDVYFATNNAIAEVCKEAGYPGLEAAMVVRLLNKA